MKQLLSMYILFFPFNIILFSGINGVEICYYKPIIIAVASLLREILSAKILANQIELMH